MSRHVTKPKYAERKPEAANVRQEAMTALEQMKRMEKNLEEKFDVIREEIPHGYRLVYVKKQDGESTRDNHSDKRD